MMTPLNPVAVRQMWQVCLMALMTWREAAGASQTAKIAVAFTVLTRLARHGWMGKSIEEVIAKPWQYSSMGDPKDAQLTKWPHSDDPSFLECMAVATAVISGDVENPFPTASHYYDSSMADHPPTWAATAKFLGKLESAHGNDLLFYEAA